MTTDKKLSVDEMLQLARVSSVVTRVCACSAEDFRGWTRIPVKFPEQLMKAIGTLVADPYVEATYEEYHPAGTTYWSTVAPIALRHFPYNRCSVLQCSSAPRAAAPI